MVKLPADDDLQIGRASTDDVEAVERDRVDAHELSWSLRELTRLSTEVDVELARRLRLRPLDNTALDHVMTAGRPIGPLELSQRLGLSSGSTTELVDRLERAGHVERRRDSEDRRRVSLHVTEPAVQRILSELRPLFEALDAVGNELTVDEQAIVGRYLRSAAQALRSYVQAE